MRSATRPDAGEALLGAHFPPKSEGVKASADSRAGTPTARRRHQLHPALEISGPRGTSAPRPRPQASQIIYRPRARNSPIARTAASCITTP